MTTHPSPPGAGNTPSEHVHTVIPSLGTSRLEQALLPEESVAEFRQLRLGIHEDLRPHGVFGMWLVDRFLLNHWRMQRAAIGEAELIAQRRVQATAWENPRRVKTQPTAGAVWADDQQHYGGALEKLGKHEYRLSLDAARSLRELARKEKARRSRTTAEEPQMTQIDTDELLAGIERQFDLRTSAQSAAPMPSREATDPPPKSGNLKNELPPLAGKAKSPESNSNPISRGANSPTNETKPIFPPAGGPGSRTASDWRDGANRKFCKTNSVHADVGWVGGIGNKTGTGCGNQRSECWLPDG